MKRTGIFALAAASAMGITALVGGIGYASALDVAEQAGRSLDVKGVSTVAGGSPELAGSPKLDPAATTPGGATADDATDGATTEEVPAAGGEAADPPADDGTVDEGSGDAVDAVDPPDPVVIDDVKKGEKGDKRCGSLKKERAAWLAAQQDGTGDPAAEWADKDWSKDGSTWSEDGKRWADKSWGDKRWGDKSWGDKRWGDQGWSHPSQGGTDPAQGDGDKQWGDQSWGGTSGDGGDRRGDGRQSGTWGGGGHHGGWGGGRH